MASKKKGKLIVIGGNDGTGKNTQTRLLVERINQESKSKKPSAHYFTFPDYDQYWGIKVNEYLGRGAQPMPEEVAGDPYQAAMLYALDRRMVTQQKIIPLLAAGKVCCCDRYMESNLAHQTVKLVDPIQRDKFLDSQHFVEFEHFGIPKPDLVLILTLDPAVRAAQTEARRQEWLAANPSSDKAGQVGAFDRHEQNLAYMEAVNAFYPELATRYNWPVIECSKNGQQLSREEIAALIWTHVHPIL
jgi:dTMP kinase